ncbi:hypothetical protein PC120_g15146 [Phytophthora cactorum]|nr:hypothetical protein PC120_g15146 [Phytophthora cactorum]
MAAQALLHDEKGLAGKAVDEFPSLFRSNDRRVNLNIARDWWRKRPAENDDETADSKPLKYARSGAGNRHQFLIKSARGREPKLGEHSSWLYPTLLTEFERLRKAGVKMSTRLLQTAAECMRRVNAECDKTGANRAKTSMVHCGLDVGADDVWKVEQLGKDLQEIIAEYPDEFRKSI